MVHASFIPQPTSGVYQEKTIDAHAGDCIIRPWSWVLFSKEDYSEWVASIHGGENAYRHVELVGNIAFVVADGQGYFIDVQKEEFVKSTDEGTIVSLVADDQNGLFIYVEDNRDVLLVDRSLVARSLSIPFQFYTIQLEKIAGDFLQITYEEMTTGDFKTGWIDVRTVGAGR